MNDVALAKKNLRASMRAIREGLGADERARIDALIADRLCAHELYRQADAVFTYLSVGSEVDTRAIIQNAWSRGKLVAVPRCIPKTNRMEWYRIEDFSNIEISSFGVEEPLPDEHSSVEVPAPDSRERAIAIVPAYTFDAEKYRLGYGGGFYDVFLPTFGGTSIGLCRSCQLSSISIPHDEYDQPVDLVIHE